MLDSDRDPEIFDDSAHMSGVDFIFPAEFVGLPAKQQNVKYIFDYLVEEEKEIGVFQPESFCNGPKCVDHTDDIAPDIIRKQLTQKSNS